MAVLEGGYYAKITEVGLVTGSGGGLTVCRLKLFSNDEETEPTGRTLTRIISGSVRLDDVIVIMDNEREQRTRLR